MEASCRKTILVVSDIDFDLLGMLFELKSVIELHVKKEDGSIHCRTLDIF